VTVDGGQPATAEIPASSWAEVEIPLEGVSAGRRHISVIAPEGRSFAAMHYWVYER